MIPIVFLIAGLALLALSIPGWSLIIGLPITIFGVVFLLYTYDEVVSKKVIPIQGEIADCVACGKPTPIFPGQDPNDVVCPVCQGQLREKK